MPKPKDSDWFTVEDNTPPIGVTLRTRLRCREGAIDRQLRWLRGEWYLPRGTKPIHLQPTHWRHL